MPIQGSFDARQFQPRQAGDAHPPGKFQATISNTSIAETKDKTGGMFVVEFTTPAGSIITRYNLWNSSPKAVEIAQHELSALCHATGVFNLDFQNDGAALRNARCMIDVGPQMKDGQPTNYVEVKKVFDANGNEPGKNAAPGQQTNQAPAQQPQGQPPMQQNQPGGAWGAPPQNNAPPANQAGGWGTPPANNPAPGGQPTNPPWGR